jgi:hypothetical protein
LIALTVCVAARAPHRALEKNRILKGDYDPSAKVPITDMDSVRCFDVCCAPIRVCGARRALLILQRRHVGSPKGEKCGGMGKNVMRILQASDQRLRTSIECNMGECGYRYGLQRRERKSVASNRGFGKRKDDVDPGSGSTGCAVCE